MDIECDSRNLDQVIRMLQREVHSVTYATNIAGEEVVPMTPLSASFGEWNGDGAVATTTGEEEEEDGLS